MRPVFVGSLLALVVAGCARDDAVAAQALDVTPPVVLALSPPVAAADVPLDDAVAVVFSEEMDAESVASAFSISGPRGLVPGARRLDGNRDALRFLPHGGLDAAAEFTVAVSTVATDLAGNPLAAPATWSFRTARGRSATHGSSGSTGHDHDEDH